jgi:hypothetical protein
VTCTTNITGSHPTGLDLKAGSTCLNNASVVGLVLIDTGAAVSISNSSITGTVSAVDNLALTICGTAVRGAVFDTASSKYVLLGDAGDDGAPACAGNTFRGSVFVDQSQGQAEVGSNQVTGDVTVSNTSGTGPDQESGTSEVEANTVTGSLNCTNNSPPPTNDGHPNAVTGHRSDQCAGL